MHFSCGDQKCLEFNCGQYGTEMESRCDPLVKSYILPVHRNGRGQTGKFRSPNIFRPALESFVLPLFICNISENEACRRICRPIKVRPLTIVLKYNKMQTRMLENSYDDCMIRPMPVPSDMTKTYTSQVRDQSQAKLNGNYSRARYIIKFKYNLALDFNEFEQLWLRRARASDCQNCFLNVFAMYQFILFNWTEYWNISVHPAHGSPIINIFL